MDEQNDFAVESAALLVPTLNRRSKSTIDTNRIYPYAVLPIAFFSALGMAATAATSVFAYAFLLCDIPTECKNSERSSYAGVVATAICIANVCGLLVLGSMENLSKRNHKIGILLWLLCRSLSIVVLALGVHLRSIAIALSGRIFEGLASDNLLHFSLNSIYVQVSDEEEVSHFIGFSLALYMIGISLSPFVAGIFKNFRTSFGMAGAIFAVTIVYLCLFVPTRTITIEGYARLPEPYIMPDSEESRLRANKLRPKGFQTSLSTILLPIKIFYERPITLAFGVSLFLYNSMQSYIFEAIMVHTTLRFGFSSRQNGIVLALAHSVAATYLFLTIFLVPRIIGYVKKTSTVAGKPLSTLSGSANALLAVISLVIQVSSLIYIFLATKASHVYRGACLTALGLATPSFIKCYFVSLFEVRDRGAALAALASMEVMGGIFAPIILGGSQLLWPGGRVFLTAAAIVGLSACFFGVGVLIEGPWRKRQK